MPTPDVRPASIVARYKKAVGALSVGAVFTAVFVLTGIQINEELATPIVTLVTAGVVAYLRNR